MSIQTMPELIKQVTSISSQKTPGKCNVEIAREILSDKINQVFGVFRAAFPGHYESLYGDSSKLDGAEAVRDKEQKKRARGATKRLWMSSPEFQQLRQDQIERAVRLVHTKCRFVPSLAEFLELAADRPEDFGLPTEDDAWLEANDKRHLVMQGGRRDLFSHPVVYLAGRGLWHRMGMADEIGMKQIRAEFDRAYQREAARVISGNDASSELMQIEDRSSYADKQLLQTKFDIERQMEQQGITQDAGAARARLRGLF